MGRSIHKCVRTPSARSQLSFEFLDVRDICLLEKQDLAMGKGCQVCRSSEAGARELDVVT